MTEQDTTDSTVLLGLPDADPVSQAAANNDLFSTPAKAYERARQLGLGEITSASDGHYMPGEDPETYSEHLSHLAMLDIAVGDRFRDELNNDEVEVTEIQGDVATVETADTQWRERVRDIREKVIAGDFTPLETGAGVAAVASEAEIPMADDAQLLYPTEDQAEAAGEILGLTGTHSHDLDGETWYMPGENHEVFEDALAQEEFADYEDFDACVADNQDKRDPEAYCAAIKRDIEGEAVTMKGEFSEGEAVYWEWQGERVHGRVADENPEQATVSGNTITGDEGEPVYVIDEYDEDVDALRRENVAKPESSLNESGRDLPTRSDGNYVSSQAWASLTTSVSQSDFTARELDYIADDIDGVLTKLRPNEWLLHDSDPVVYRADIPEKYLDGRSEDFFVPNEGMAEAARKVGRWNDEHGRENVAGGGDDGEGERRRNQIIEYAERGEPLPIEYWEEILNFHNRKHAQDAHELESEYEGEPHRDAGYVGHLRWGGDAGYDQAQRVVDAVESVDQESAVEMRGAVATEQSLDPNTITKANSNEVDLDALEGELREAVEADDFYIYGKASIEQWDDDDPPTFIQMEALDGALDRYFESDVAPGIISRHHQDIPVGKPVREFEFESDTTLEIDGETYRFEAGDTARSHVEDADGDGRPELWLAANVDNETEMGKKTRVLAAQGDLNGFSVTVHRNRDEMTQEGRVVTDCDLHAVTIGTGEQIKNPGSEFDVASYKGPVAKVKDAIRGILQ